MNLPEIKIQNTDQIKNLESGPGVYIFYNAEKEVIYVGKAINLKRRVGQYFQKNLEDGKTAKLVSEIAFFGRISVFSEIEALILEAELISNLKPRYNINLKDDKSYLYIVIRAENSLSKVMTARRPDIKKKDKVFGPYPDSATTKSLLRVCRKIFPYRDCSEGKFNRYRKLGAPCLYGHLGLCPAPCLKSVDRKDYQRNILRLEKFLRGGSGFLERDLKSKMKKAVATKDYENAAFFRDELKKLAYVQQKFRLPKEFMENPYLVDDITAKSLSDLVEAIPALQNLPSRIECYDIANISGKSAACSMVVATDGRIDKSSYRKFKIKLKETPDDFLMIKEALTRRLLHEVRENKKPWGKPDLIVIDGGKGQVSAALEVLALLHLQTPLVGLAKKQETLIYKSEEGFIELKLPRDHEGLKLLQRLRDEAHRFARAYHHNLRSATIK